jgi:hypothetical protein
MKVKVYALFCIIMAPISFILGMDFTHINFASLDKPGEKAVSYVSELKKLATRINEAKENEKYALRIQLEVMAFLRSQPIGYIQEFLRKNGLSAEEEQGMPKIVLKVSSEIQLRDEDTKILNSIMEKLERVCSPDVIDLFLSPGKLEQYTGKLNSDNPQDVENTQETIRKKVPALNEYLSSCQKWASILVNYEYSKDLAGMTASLIKLIHDVQKFYETAEIGPDNRKRLRENQNSLLNQIPVQFYITITKIIDGVKTKYYQPSFLEAARDRLRELNRALLLNDEQRRVISQQAGLPEDIEVYIQEVLRQGSVPTSNLPVIDLDQVLSRLSKRYRALSGGSHLE